MSLLAFLPMKTKQVVLSKSRASSPEEKAKQMYAKFTDSQLNIQEVTISFKDGNTHNQSKSKSRNLNCKSALSRHTKRIDDKNNLARRDSLNDRDTSIQREECDTGATKNIRITENYFERKKSKEHLKNFIFKSTKHTLTTSRSKSFISKRTIIRKRERSNGNSNRKTKNKFDSNCKALFKPSQRQPKEILSINLNKKRRIKNQNEERMENKDIMAIKSFTPKSVHRKAKLNEYIQNKGNKKRCRSSHQRTKEIPECSISESKANYSKQIVSHTISRFEKIYMNSNKNKLSVNNQSNIRIHMNYNKKINKQKIKYRENLKLIDCQTLRKQVPFNKDSEPAKQ